MPILETEVVEVLAMKDTILLKDNSIGIFWKHKGKLYGRSLEIHKNKTTFCQQFYKFLKALFRTLAKRGNMSLYAELDQVGSDFDGGYSHINSIKFVERHFRCTYPQCRRRVSAKRFYDIGVCKKCEGL